ncbi:hypothetical protein GCM10007067_21730 [Lysobacter bugurensis]|uniref:TonB C-terminal domain-containing protein n=2 Tax=Cognatilysobacter bugurensis TaxID=543356 RepID=A0A918T4I5_9GAMM|nr:hypothetical protein GCM10007067_21730 [Lysobacter bugurensis]
MRHAPAFLLLIAALAPGLSVRAQESEYPQHMREVLEEHMRNAERHQGHPGKFAMYRRYVELDFGEGAFAREWTRRHGKRIAAPRPPLRAAGDGDPVSVNQPAPAYPPALARSGAGGTVVLVLSVDAEGAVTQVDVETSSGHAGLDAIAQATAYWWQFRPAYEHGNAVRSRVRVPVDFVPPR